MSATHQPSFLLKSLPPDILGELLSFDEHGLNAQDLAHLWLTGDAFLQRKLSASVKDFYLEYSPYRPVVWPRFIRQLPNLRSLMLISPSVPNPKFGVRITSVKAFSLSIENVCSKDLPSSLTRLTIDACNAEYLFFTKTVDGYCAKLDICEHLPHLKSLTLKGESIGDHRLTYALIKNLPKNLSKLHLVNTDLHEELIALLPRTLQLLKINDIILPTEYSQDTPAPIVGWPPELHSLSFDNICARTLNLSPQYAHRLICAVPSSKFPLVLANLPSASLKSLTIRSTGIYLDEKLMAWICNTFDLDILTASIIDQVYWSLHKQPLNRLPRQLCLREYPTNNDDQPSFEDLKHFPTSMRRLEVLHQQFASIVDVTSEMLKLPSSLTHLCLSSRKIPFSRIDFGALTSLKQLELHIFRRTFNENLDFEFLTHLSPSLQCLRLDYLDFDQFAHLPVALLELKLENVERGKNYQQPQWPSQIICLKTLIVRLEDGIDPKLFVESLPSSVTSLSLSAHQLTDECAHHLPPRLQSLSITLSGSHQQVTSLVLTNEFLRHLPQSLKALTIKSSPIDFDDESIVVLPCRLTSLMIESPSAITQEGLKNLPPHLLCLALNLPKLAAVEASLVLPHRLMAIQLWHYKLNNPIQLPKYWRLFNSTILLVHRHLRNALKDTEPNPYQ
jgi:hypothetical protein